MRKKKKKNRNKNTKVNTKKNHLKNKLESEERYDHGPQKLERYIFLGILFSAIIFLMVYLYGLIMILIG